MSSSDEAVHARVSDAVGSSTRKAGARQPTTRPTWACTVSLGARVGRSVQTDNTSRVEVDHTDYFTTTQLFDSGDELVAWARSVARALFVKLIRKSTPKIKKVCLTCDLFGGPRESNVEPSSKRSGSKKVKCGFQIVGDRRLDDRWELRIVFGKHNHFPIYMSGHGLSALNEAESKIIKDLSQSHVPPKKILANLRQNGLGLDAYSKQIYNEKAKLRRLARGDRTVMQHLIGLLEKHNYYKWLRTDETT
ncbi:PREDICTED: uncharacterized protein LOC105967446 [Erythranthe guttata]|uniref:uncharacterized protein LOC105967446 n=1 Tax=Erythranthe guttata TaxID=4155 RepID=UPI00064D745F|nr:PREDICTED: uncharacterized protein LOC105967446 [Erythranthe guttata]|eukprot:XP_012847495.1 PREDICTED: uncharacterized protein LOC105967446 [Erythranthe guttata]